MDAKTNGWDDYDPEAYIGPAGQLGPLPFPDFGGPSVDTLSTSANIQPRQLDTLHARRVRQPGVTSHAAGVCSLLRHELQHGKEEIGHALALFFLEVVLLPENVGQGPMT